MIATCRCGLSWGGLRTSHCTVCHQTFSNDWIGDLHQIGEHHPDTRRCLTDTEMTDKGWRQLTDATGNLVWRGPAMPADVLAKRRASA